LILISFDVADGFWSGVSSFNVDAPRHRSETASFVNRREFDTPGSRRAWRLSIEIDTQTAQQHKGKGGAFFLNAKRKHKQKMKDRTDSRR
jgi:hypothetical protein